MDADEDQAAKATRDPVAPAKRSRKALEKIATKETADGFEVHSLRTLLKNLAGIVKYICKRKGDTDNVTTALFSTPTPAQKRALELLAAIEP